MQAILTKYLGPTNNRGSRIKAWTQGHSITIGYMPELNSEENHHTAAFTLCQKMGWEEQLGGGWVKGGYAFVRIPPSWQEALTENNNHRKFMADLLGNTQQLNED